MQTGEDPRQYRMAFYVDVGDWLDAAHYHNANKYLSVHSQHPARLDSSNRHTPLPSGLIVGNYEEFHRSQRYCYDR
jgi:hypothetical protein